MIPNRTLIGNRGSGLPRTTATALAVLTYTPATQAARALFEDTGEPHPLVVVLEEAGALGLVTPVITTAMQAYRKHGVSVWAASQTVHDFQDEETFESRCLAREARHHRPHRDRHPPAAPPVFHPAGRRAAAQGTHEVRAAP